jgi:hypothetical protein
LSKQNSKTRNNTSYKICQSVKIKKKERNQLVLSKTAHLFTSFCELFIAPFFRRHVNLKTNIMIQKARFPQSLRVKEIGAGAMILVTGTDEAGVRLRFCQNSAKCGGFARVRTDKLVRIIVHFLKFIKNQEKY